MFSHKSSIFRAYVYNLNNKSKLTIECYNEDENIKNLFDTINNIFSKFDISLNLTTRTKFYSKTQKRYFCVTLNDQKIIDKFHNNTKQTNLVCGAWDIFHRDRKINKILSFFNE